VTRSDAEPDAKAARTVIARAFTLIEDVVYIGIGVLLAVSAAVLLVNGAVSLWRATAEGTPLPGVINLLDRTLLVLMLVELLYTVQVSFREHALLPEPFLIVGLIAATRRILVVTAEFSVAEKTGAQQGRFRDGMLEIALLTIMIVALVGSLLMLRRVRDSAKLSAPRS
jgi:uncharacterized membrane protein (DUF373 family)